VAIPDSVLLKPGKLNEEEFRLMQQHPLVGERICGPLKSFQLVVPIIRHHHEKLNGTGYPDGLRHGAIPLLARVMQVVDVFDALTTERPYKCAYSVAETLNIMHDEVSRGWWDPEIFSAFSTMMSSTMASANRATA
jgi:putative two-component system response regulator